MVTYLCFVAYCPGDCVPQPVQLLVVSSEHNLCLLVQEMAGCAVGPNAGCHLVDVSLIVIVLEAGWAEEM